MSRRAKLRVAAKNAVAQERSEYRGHGGVSPGGTPEKKEFTSDHEELKYILAQFTKRMDTELTEVRAALYRLEHQTVTADDIQDAADEAGLNDQQVLEAKTAFEVFDSTNHGFIDRADMHKAMASMGRPMARQELEDLIDSWDTHGHGTIELDDFIAIYAKILEQNPAESESVLSSSMSEYGQDALVRWTQYDAEELCGDATGPGVALYRRFFRKLVLLKSPEYFIYLVILLAGIFSSLEPFYRAHTGTWWFYTIEYSILAIFAAELVVKILAESAGHAHIFFTDGWNVFDFIITLVLLILTPLGSEEVAVGRLLRLLRAIRLIRTARFMPKLMIVLEAMVKSASSALYIMVCLGLVMYIYAVMGTTMFGENDPFHFGTLPQALISLFRISTLEDWTDIMYINIYGCTHWGRYAEYASSGTEKCKDERGGVMAVFFFLTYVMLTSFMLLNLFIGVITTEMANASEHMTKQLEDRQRRSIASRIRGQRNGQEGGGGAIGVVGAAFDSETGSSSRSPKGGGVQKVAGGTMFSIAEQQNMHSPLTSHGDEAPEQTKNPLESQTFPNPLGPSFITADALSQNAFT